MKKTVKAAWIILASFLILASVIFLGCSSDSDHRQIMSESPTTDESVADYSPLVTESSEAAAPDGETDEICDTETQPLEEIEEIPHLEHTVDIELPIPHWQSALEEFLNEFLPIFTAPTTRENWWNEWEVGGWWRFVRESTYLDQYGWDRPIFYLVDPVTEELVDVDTVPYVFEIEWIDHDLTSIYIADSFYLHDICGDGIPELFINWHIIDGDPFGFVNMFRYIDGGYEPVSVSRRHLQHWREDTLNSPILFHWGASLVNELLAIDSEGRILTLGVGGAGGIESSASILKLNNNGVVIEPIFHMRYGTLWDESNDSESGFRLYVDESIKKEYEFLLEPDIDNVVFFSWDWFQGEGDMTPVQLPVLPDITVLPLPRMTELEESIIERITARLTQEGRIIS